jgi:Na+/H+-translocating membrane pyrophosphatase
LSALPGFTLGAAVTALVIQRAAGTYRAASEVGAGVAGELHKGLSREDPRNPALIGCVAGTLLSGHAATAALSFTLSSASHLCTLSLATRAIESGAPASCLLVPFVARAFFVLASGFGLVVVRTEEMRSPSVALFRGFLCCAIVGWVGVLGTSLWLLRSDWVKPAAAGAAGLGIALLLAFASWTAARRSGVPLSELDAEEAVGAKGHGVGSLSSAAKGFHAVLLPVVLTGPLAAGWAWGSASTDGAVFAVAALVGWSALVGMLPFTLAAAGAGTSALAARALLGLAGVEFDAQRRIQRLSEARHALVTPRAQFVLLLAGTALVTALAVPSLAARAGGIAVDLLEPSVLWAAALGAAVVLSYAGASAGAAAKGAHGVALEVERQLQAAPRATASSPLPEDFSPSYKTCVDLAAEVSRTRVLPQVLAATALPIVAVVAIRLLVPSAPAALVVNAVVAFVAAAGFTGFAAALTLDTAHASVVGRRLKRAADGAVPPVAAAGEALTSVLGQAAAPAAEACVLATAAVALVIAPFLT